MLRLSWILAGVKEMYLFQECVKFEFNFYLSVQKAKTKVKEIQNVTKGKKKKDG